MEEKRKASNIQKGKQLITDTLIYLSNQAAAIDELFDLWRYRGRFPMDPETEKKVEERKLRNRERQRLEYLKKKKLITIKKKEGVLIANITKKGRVELVVRTMRDRPVLGLGQVCLIVYDFPTGARKGRDAFRSFLKRAGCVQIQKSVWRSDRDIVSDVKEFVKKAKATDWVEIFVSKKC